MAKTTIGYSHCPECDSVQAVQSDGLKYLIHCSDCGTFTHYQRKEAKKRIEEKLLPEVTEELEPIEPEAAINSQPELPAQKTSIEPEKKPEAETPEQPKSFFDAIAQYL